MFKNLYLNKLLYINPIVFNENKMVILLIMGLDLV